MRICRLFCSNLFLWSFKLMTWSSCSKGHFLLFSCFDWWKCNERWRRWKNKIQSCQSGGEVLVLSGENTPNHLFIKSAILIWPFIFRLQRKKKREQFFSSFLSVMICCLWRGWGVIVRWTQMIRLRFLFFHFEFTPIMMTVTIYLSYKTSFFFELTAHSFNSSPRIHIQLSSDAQYRISKHHYSTSPTGQFHTSYLYSHSTFFCFKSKITIHFLYEFTF